MPFRHVTGHRPVLELLARAVARGSVPPTLVFGGPEGVGKRLTAIALAQALNCELGEDACGTCAACTRIARGVHADVMIVEPGDSGSIKIDQIREAIDRSAYRPFEGRRRVVIIDNADALVGEAQNALLKTLEEPPPSSVFVLVTARPDLLLPTVRSRAHRLRFGALSQSDVAAILMKNHGFSDADAHAAAATSDGSVGRALEENSEEAIEARDAATRLLQAAASSRDPRRRLDGAKGLAGSGDREEVWRRLLALSSLLRDMSVLATGADEQVLSNTDLRPQLKALIREERGAGSEGRGAGRDAGCEGRSAGREVRGAGREVRGADRFDAGRTVRAFAAVDRALAAIDRNASPKIVADWLALQL